MSRAFVKETDSVEELPDRPVSKHRNLVTAEGLAAIDAEIARLDAERSGAGDDRAAIAAIDRDLRYWRQRRASAELVPPAKPGGKVQFGSTVRIRRDDGREHAMTIVGEDESDPVAGKVSYVSPVAKAMIGKAPGDIVDVGPVVIEILAVE